MKSIAIIILTMATVTSFVASNGEDKAAPQHLVTDSSGSSTPFCRDEVSNHFGLEVLMVVEDLQGQENYAKVRVAACLGQRVFATDPSNRIGEGFYRITASSGGERFVNKQLVIYRRLPSEMVVLHEQTFEDQNALMNMKTGK